MRWQSAICCGLSFLLTSAIAGSSHAADQSEEGLANFYHNKTMKIVIGFPPGGGYDLYSRLIAQHMPKYIPGNPRFIVENRPGAGSLVAANALYNTELKDGTVFGTISEGLPLQQRLGAEGVSFDARNFNWLGSAVQTTYACAARTALNIHASDLFQGKPLLVAGSDPGSSPYDVPAVLKSVLGMQLKIVAGYRSTPTLMQSIENGETDATCSTLSTLLEPAGQPLSGGPTPLGKLFLVFASSVPAIQAENAWVKGTSSADSLAQTSEAKAVLAAFDAPARMHKPFVAPPGVPPERVAMLTRALAETFADKNFRSDLARMGLVASPISGEEATSNVHSVLELPDKTMAVLKQALAY